jgi:hypothetical protein
MPRCLLEGLGNLIRMSAAVWLVLCVTLALGALLSSGCGGDEPRGEFEGLAPEDPGPVHVHGLGVNPADSALFIATHTGLYRTDEHDRKAERVGDSQQDTMGFTVVGPDYFLGSGHPDADGLQAGEPPLLGLIQSNDGGETWQPVSLRGEADFHVLRFVGERVYGYDASNNRLLASTDNGRSWDERTTPAPLVDLAADPARRGHLLAAGQGGLFRSNDDGRTWGALGEAPGLLAWPTERALYLVDGAGAVYVSADAGNSLTPIGEIGGEPAAFVTEGERELYVALHDGTVKVSTDGGRTWGVRSST